MEESRFFNHNIFGSIDKLKKLLESAGVGVYLFEENRLIYANKKLVDMFGYSVDEIGQKDISLLISPEDRKNIEDKIKSQIDNNISYMDYLFKGLTKDKKRKYIHSYCSIVESSDSKLLMCILIDKTKIIEANRELERLANYDNLTKIFNKRVFEEELDRILELAKRKKTKVALLLFDIDHFKRINDSLGHRGGDIALKELTDRIQSTLRKSELFARIGGDEFGLIIENVRDTDEIVALISRLQNSIKGQIRVNDTKIRITLSIGVALFPEHSSDKSTMMRAADIALYEAKKAGRNRYIFYAKNSKELLENIELGKNLESALQKNQMQINLQPQISLKSDSIYSAEALLRWHHPKKGVLKPREFLPQASKAGILYQLDLFVLESVLKFLQEIRGKSPIHISINISNALFHHQKFYEAIMRLKKSYGELFSKVELELDQKLLQSNDKYTKRVIQCLSDHGFSLSIDNFGLGLTSFRALQELKVSRVNIDISLIKEIEYNLELKSIVQAIINMAKALNLKVLAEGVEREETLFLLKELDCDIVQGYYYSYPLPVEEFKNLWIEC